MVNGCKKWRTFFLIAFALLQSQYLHGQGSSPEGRFGITFSYSRNYYNQPFELILTPELSGATVVYTLNCDLPTVDSGFIYTNEIDVDSTCVVKAVAFRGADTSIVVTHTFIFPYSVAKQAKIHPGFPTNWGGSSNIHADYEMDPEVTENPDDASQIGAALRSIPTISLTMKTDDWFNPATGLYVGYPNSNVTREKAVTAEFIFADSTENFEVNCGVCKTREERVL